MPPRPLTRGFYGSWFRGDLQFQPMAWQPLSMPSREVAAGNLSDIS
jgi:hypothetical protein